MVARSVGCPCHDGGLTRTGDLCPSCGYFNASESNVRDVPDGRVFCNCCGVMFEVR